MDLVAGTSNTGNFNDTPYRVQYSTDMTGGGVVDAGQREQVYGRPAYAVLAHVGGTFADFEQAPTVTFL
jgi:hypothetical protein